MTVLNRPKPAFAKKTTAIFIRGWQSDRQNVRRTHDGAGRAWKMRAKALPSDGCQPPSLLRAGDHVCACACLARAVILLKPFCRATALKPRWLTGAMGKCVGSGPTNNQSDVPKRSIQYWRLLTCKRLPISPVRPCAAGFDIVFANPARSGC